MYVVIDYSIDPNTRAKGIGGLIQLLDYVESKWGSFQLSTSRTMQSLKVPPEIERIFVAGVIYTLAANRREVWFKRTATRRGYDSNRFFVSEAIDDSGHTWQLELDRTLGAFDGVVLTRATRLDGARTMSCCGPTGPSIRE